jgi:hypothetical protein
MEAHKGVEAGGRRWRPWAEAGSQGWRLVEADDISHFAAAIAAAAGASTGLSPFPFCASGLGWGSRWSQSLGRF